MKKLLCLLLIGGALASFTSCTKTCTCTDNVLGTSYEYPIKSGVYKAVNNCNELQDILNVNGTTNVFSCK